MGSVPDELLNKIGLFFLVLIERVPHYDRCVPLGFILLGYDARVLTSMDVLYGVPVQAVSE